MKMFSLVDSSFTAPPRAAPFPFITTCSPLAAGVGVDGEATAAACLRVLTLDMVFIARR